MSQNKKRYKTATCFEQFCSCSRTKNLRLGAQNAYLFFCLSDTVFNITKAYRKEWREKSMSQSFLQSQDYKVYGTYAIATALPETLSKFGTILQSFASTVYPELFQKLLPQPAEYIANISK